MIKIGLTGGIGSGKSIVAKIFESLKIPVFYADDVAKEIVNTDPQIIAKLTEKFGKEIYNNNQLNRPLLAKIVFEDDTALKFVNALIHPAVAIAYQQWVDSQDAPYCLKEAAILFEIGSYKHYDKIILVTADQEVRIKRVIDRNDWSREEVLKRMENQWSDEKKIPLADFVIYNDQKEMLIPQILAVHENLISSTN